METLQISKNQNHLRKVLIENFSLLKARNSAFSMRSYARKLSISAPALSEMMNGKRNITNKTALKIFERLNISPEEREKLSKISKSKKMVSGKQYLQIEMDHYHLMSEWYYFGILSLAETENFNDDPAWVAARLNIKIHEAKTAIDRLERLGLLKKK